METLKDIMATYGMTLSEGQKKSRALAIKLISEWYETEKTGGQGKVAYLSLKNMLTPNVKNINGQKQPTKTTTTTYRKEFKIHGSVDTKAGLSFVSLVRQIYSGLKRGYS